jgi:hypothetical protein
MESVMQGTYKAKKSNGVGKCVSSSKKNKINIKEIYDWIATL